MADQSEHDGTERRVRQEPFDGPDKRGPRGDGLYRLLRAGAIAITSAAALIPAVMGIWPYMPIARAEAQAADAAIIKRVEVMESAVQGLNTDVASLKRDMSGILTTGKKTQVLAIRSRLLEIQDRKAKVEQGSDIWKDYAKEQIDLEEDLRALRNELGK